MSQYPHPKDVPGLEHVVSALRTAERVEAEGPPFELCICDSEGRPIAAASLSGFDRVEVFSRAMAKLGFAAQIPSDPRAGCDVTYMRAKDVRDIFDDGSDSSPAPLA